MKPRKKRKSGHQTLLRRARQELAAERIESARLLQKQEERHRMEMQPLLRLVKACKYRNNDSRSETISISVRVDEGEFYGIKDAEVIWQDILGQLAVGFGSKLCKNNMEVMRRAYQGLRNQELYEIKQSWIHDTMRDSSIFGVSPETCAALWDRIMAWLMDNAPRGRGRY